MEDVLGRLGKEFLMERIKQEGHQHENWVRRSQHSYTFMQPRRRRRELRSSAKLILPLARSSQNRRMARRRTEARTALTELIRPSALICFKSARAFLISRNEHWVMSRDRRMLRSILSLVSSSSGIGSDRRVAVTGE